MRSTEGQRPDTRWALASLVFSLVGCPVAAVLPASYFGGLGVETTGVTASVALLQVGLLAGLLCLCGIAFGIVALRKSRGGAYGGRGKARVGIGLGFLPFAALLVGMAPTLW